MILNSIQIKNFKAIRDSGSVKLKPLTVIIGNNGSGKSSLIEAMETYQTYVSRGLDEAMQRFLGLEHVQNKYAKPDSPISFQFKVRLPKELAKGQASLGLKVATNSSKDRYEVLEESLQSKGMGLDLVWPSKGEEPALGGMPHNFDNFGVRSLLQSVNIGKATNVFFNFVASWQSFSLQPEQMGMPRPQSRFVSGHITLARDGSNIAEYLLNLRDRSPSTLEKIIDAMAFVLPYGHDLQPAITSELERKAWLQLSEGHFKVPGWMLSTGTLRALSLFAVLMDPALSSVLLIEELENGLDPRTIGLVVDLMRTATMSGRLQVIATTHSPYLLDMLELDDVLLCERGVNGPMFTWPSSRAEMQIWRNNFMPGKLYTMNALQHEPKAPIADDIRQEGEAPARGWGEEE